MSSIACIKKKHQQSQKFQPIPPFHGVSEVTCALWNNSYEASAWLLSSS
jgi:hypothetical protein